MNIKEAYYNEYVNVVTDLELQETLYISLKNHLMYLFDEEPNNLNEIEKISSRIAKTLQKIKHNNNVMNELKQLV